MRDKLRSLYALQKIDAQLDELHERRGDLPETVKTLKDKFTELKEKIEDIDSFLKQGAIDRDRKDKESLALLEKIDKYKAQQLQVRTNKEYDKLTSEIDYANSTIQAYEDEVETFAEEAQAKKEQREELNAQLEILGTELEEKETELNEILASTEAEEKILNSKKQKVVKMISEDDMVSYLRIREAKRGKAVVPIKRGSCSGCYNMVPPQLILQIKKDDKLYLCEHCGRILVSEDLALDESPLQ